MAEALDRMSSAVNYNRWLVERARPYVGRKVLDLGAGLGIFTELLASHADVVALEPDPALAARLRRRVAGSANVTVVDGDASMLQDEISESFDAIVCLNVLEHIAEETQTLRACFDRLRPGGYLLLLVPAHSFLSGEIDRMGGHVRRYDRRHLRRTLTSTGFAVTELRHVNPVGALGWLMFSKILRRNHVPTGPLGAYDRLVPLLRLLDRLRLPFGLSLWAVARRPSATE